MNEEWAVVSKEEAAKMDGDTAKFAEKCPGCGEIGVFIYKSKDWNCKYCTE